MYSTFRIKYLPTYLPIFENINPNKSSFTSIMMTRNEECLRQLGSYIYRAMHIHKEYNS